MGPDAGLHMIGVLEGSPPGVLSSAPLPIAGTRSLPRLNSVIPVSIYNDTFAANPDGAGDVPPFRPMDGGSDPASAVSFRATEAARFAFLAAVKGMTLGEHPPDIDYLIRLTDRLLEAHHQETAKPASQRVAVEF